MEDSVPPGASHGGVPSATTQDAGGSVAALLRRLNAWFLECAPEHYRGIGLHIDVEAALDRTAPCEPMIADDEGWSEWVHPIPGYRMQCCDCGLIHEMEFAIGLTNAPGGGPFNEGESDGGVILFRARRAVAMDGAAEKSDAAIRRTVEEWQEAYEHAASECGRLAGLLCEARAALQTAPPSADGPTGSYPGRLREGDQ